MTLTLTPTLTLALILTLTLTLTLTPSQAEEQSILFTPFDVPITVQAMRALLISV